VGCGDTGDPDGRQWPIPATAPVTVSRRASNSGVIMVVGQKIALGWIAHAVIDALALRAESAGAPDHCGLAAFPA
jgi:hypothetical protein